MGFSCGSVVKNLPANAGDAGSIRGLRTFPRGGNGNPLQYSYLGNPMDRGDWQATVHGVTKRWIWLSNWARMHSHNHRLHDGRSIGHQNLTKARGWDAFSLLSLIFHLQMPLCSVVSDSVTQWTVICQAPLSMGFSRQEYWSGLPFPSPGILLSPGTEPMFPALQADSSLLSHWGNPRGE